MTILWLNLVLLVCDRFTKMWALTQPQLLFKNTSYFSLPAIVCLGVLLLFSFKNKRWTLTTSLIITAGFSNLFDRLYYGFVIDWINLPLIPAVFNLADLAISCCLIRLLYYLFLRCM